jgi:hypothetical protein
MLLEIVSSHVIIIGLISCIKSGTQQKTCIKLERENLYDDIHIIAQKSSIGMYIFLN